MPPIGIIIVLGALALGSFLGYSAPAKKAGGPVMDKKKLEEAKAEAARIKEQSKEQVSKMNQMLKQEQKDFEEQSKHLEENLKGKESILKRREDRNSSYAGNLKKFKKDIQSLEEKEDSIRKEMISELSKVAGMDAEKARKKIEDELNDIITGNKEAREKAYLEEFQEQAVHKAKSVLQPVIQRMLTISSVDKNSTSVTVKDDKFKGLLVGKDGVNIAYLESLLPISVIFNLDPSTIHVGGVNLIRRHIAKGAINRLQKRAKKSGHISHEMIKSAVDESEREIMGICDRKGKEAMKMMGMKPSDYDQEMVNYTGRLYFRTSFGQNILQHSLEMAYLARLIAEQIGTDVKTAMLAAFFHDIGKAIDHDIGGSHDDISKDILEKHKFSEDIVHAAYAHHDKVPCEKPADFIVKAVDAISGARPGARQESVTNYFERMKQLEDTAASFAGIRKVITMSAGREVRVMINEKQVKDGSMRELADNIANKISEELSFPGIIKVNLIRQSHAVDYAREKR